MAILYIVSTPIGNLLDITYRAVEVLKEVDIILCEDTRISGKLLKHYNINTPMESYFEHNEEAKLPLVLNYLENDKNVALISDAGTPLISDPGYKLVKAVSEHGYQVTSIPGASSILAALTTSGISPQPFTFIGFLPRKDKEIIKILKTYQNSNETIIIFESPHRINNTLMYIKEYLPNRQMALARELTKIHEEIVRINTLEINDKTTNSRGEYVIVISGKTEDDNFINSLTVEEHVKLYIDLGYNLNEAMKLVAKDRGVSKNEIYKVVKV